MNRIYTGVGSRTLSEDNQNIIVQVAKHLAGRGYKVRSGGADGSDSAFAKGVARYIENKPVHYDIDPTRVVKSLIEIDPGKIVKSLREIYLPWNEFNGMYHCPDLGIYDGSKSPKIFEAEEFTQRYHPKGKKLSRGAKSMMNRNAMQILGYDLELPSDFLICCSTGTKCDSIGNIYDVDGGTGQAVRIAYAYHIPVYNIANKDSYEDLCEFLNEL